MPLTAAETRFLQSWYLAEWERGHAGLKDDPPRAVAERLTDLCAWKLQHDLNEVVSWSEDLDELNGILASRIKGRNGRPAPPQTRRMATLRSQIRKVLFHSASCVARDLNAQSITAMRLPVEVLTAVFGFLSFPDCVSASHVCHGWRDVALSEPRLWNDVELSVPHLTWSSAAVPELLARSKAVPLRLTIKGLYSDDVPQIALWLSPDVLERTSYLALFFDAPCDMDSLWNALATPAPQLETLLLRSMDLVDDCIFRMPQKLFLGCAPRLRNLYASDVRVAPGCAALSSVTTLVADFVGMHHSDGDSVETSWSLLAEFPSLRFVGLNDVWEDDALPSLAGLEHVSLRTQDDDALATVLPTIGHTAVQHLTMYTLQPQLRLRDMCVELPMWTKVSIDTEEWPCQPLKSPSALSLKASHGHSPDAFTRTVVFDEFSSGLADLVGARLASDEVVLEVSEHVLAAHGFRLLAMLTSVRVLHLVAEPDARGAIFDSTRALGCIALPELLDVVITVPVECADRASEDISAFFHRNFMAPNLKSLNIVREVYVKDGAVPLPHIL
ncbi:hypothetical protein AURDEDRAFT_160381 [Auricularia subglabra TFB-10046 SS5]|nr:hypothetical protein AURDEDRAFT_160381 [Auricularia subglabra TFB-10046 SS5]